MAASAALTVLDVIERDDLRARARELGERFAAAVEDLQLPGIREVRGRGLLRGIALRDPVAARFVAAGLAAGFIVNAPRPDVIRIAPPLVIGATELDSFVDALPDLLAAAGAVT